jgi:hypothetical protein
LGNGFYVDDDTPVVNGNLDVDRPIFSLVVFEEGAHLVRGRPPILKGVRRRRSLWKADVGVKLRIVAAHCLLQGGVDLLLDERVYVTLVIGDRVQLGGLGAFVHAFCYPREVHFTARLEEKAPAVAWGGNDPYGDRSVLRGRQENKGVIYGGVWHQNMEDWIATTSKREGDGPGAYPSILA